MDLRETSAARHTFTPLGRRRVVAVVLADELRVDRVIDSRV